MPDSYTAELTRMREEIKERFEILLQSPLVIAELTSALERLAEDHQNIISNGNQVGIHNNFIQFYKFIFYFINFCHY